MRKFSRIAIIGLIVAMAVSITACGQKTEASKVDDIREAGKIVLGTSADYPPYEFQAEIDGKNTIVGFDIEIAKAIAEDLGVELEIKDMDFDGLLMALNADKVDFVVAGMTPRPDRDVEFSKIYYKAVQGLVVHVDNKDTYKSVEDLKGKRIGAQKGSIQEDLIQEEVEDIDLKGLAKIPDLVLEVKHKKIDAVIMEMPVAEAYVANNSDLHLMPIELIDEEGGSAVAAKKGQTELIGLINETLDRLEKDGSIERFVIEAVEMVE